MPTPALLSSPSVPIFQQTPSHAPPTGLETLQSHLPHPTSPWGLPIYRTTYSPSSTTAWPQFLSLIQANVTSTLSIYHLPHLSPQHSQPIFSDEATFSGLNTHAIRNHFTSWVSSQQQQQTPAGASRWGYCLMVDDICLESMDRDKMVGPVVKVVKRLWEAADYDEEEEEENEEEENNEGVEGGFRWEDGKTGDQGEDVGWMYIYIADYVEMCDILGQGEEGWYSVYARPPLMRDTDPFCEREVGRLAGWWRRVGEKDGEGSA
ncbi:hypothetical protein QBC41DRAFT_302019 [Cercophora samala]|uniref:Uncharacterized protein n=1 Tax=Cercophora samala TaxID=330535 RepID=A0AA39ZF59_9PEZI|nr:hypothetical protein QBC41DRAFT_302019 [Cercophora samala]